MLGRNARDAARRAELVQRLLTVPRDSNPLTSSFGSGSSPSRGHYQSGDLTLRSEKPVPKHPERVFGVQRERRLSGGDRSGRGRPERAEGRDVRERPYTLVSATHGEA